MPVMAEESFPRGGAPKSASKKSQKQAKTREKDLFTVSSSNLDLKKSNKKDKKKRTHVIGGSSAEDVIVIEKFSYDTVTDDMLVLGRVKEIHDYKLIVGLPENVVGELAIVDISTAYTKALKDIADNTEESDDVGSLDELFTIGQIICCRVKTVRSKGSKKEIQLTVDPNAVNRDIDIDKLSVNCVLNACVDSKEDHGYTLDIGIHGLKAFVPNADAHKFHNGKPLLVGMLIQCSMTKHSIDNVRSQGSRVVSVKLKNERHKLSAELKQLMLANILPGSIVNGTVVSVNMRGIVVNFCGKFKGYVHRHQVGADPSKFTKDQSVTMCVLYHQPLIGVTSLSMLSHLTEVNSPNYNNFELVQVGDMFESAKVLNIDVKSGALLRLTADINGYLPLKYVHDQREMCKFTDLPKFGIKCRVLDFDIMNNVAIVSTSKRYVEHEILNIRDCKAGQVIDGKIRRFVDGKIIVLIDGLYRGLIPALYNANVPLKRPENKYKIDDEIKCRILKFDKKKRDAVCLTAKESQVTTKLPILTGFEQLVKGLIVEGVVVKITNHGLVVVFYNDVRGFVPKSEAGQDLNVLQDNFYLGQVVKCRVMSWCAETQKIHLSLKLEGQEVVGTKELKVQATLDATVVHRCKVIRIMNRGLSVRVGDVSGLIPTNHLSDNLVNCKHLLKLYKPHQVIDEAALFERAVTPIFSLKKTLVDAVRGQHSPQDIGELFPGTTVNAVARNAVSFGIFIQISPSLRAIAINKFLMDQYVENAAKHYEFGQSILANIKEVEADRKRILCSLRMSDCYNGETQPAVDQLASYLDERLSIVEHYKRNGRDTMVNLLQFDVGSSLEVVIDKLSDHGAIGHERSSNVQVICTIFHMTGSSIKVGEVRKAVVLYQDLDFSCLEVSLSNKIVKAISHRMDGPSNQVKEGVVTDAEVLLVKPDFVLIGLKGRAEFKLAYAPARKCLNDVNGPQFFEPGFSDKVVVKFVNKSVICSWQAFENASGNSKLPKQVDTHKLDIGSKVRAVIKEVLPFQLNIRIGSLPGRIFASELEIKDVVPGEPITSRFKAGESLDAVVIGFRCPKSQKFIKRLREQAKGIPECSILRKRLNGDLDTKLQPGMKLHGFYQQIKDQQVIFRVTPNVFGRCQFVNADLDVAELEHPERVKSGGCYPLTVVKMKTDTASMIEVAMMDKSEIAVGSVVMGCVIKIKKKTLELRLTGNYRGILPMTEMSDDYDDNIPSTFSVGEYRKCVVIGKNYDDEDEDECVDSFIVSLRRSRYAPLCAAKIQPKDKVIESASDLIVNEIVRGYVHLCTQNSVTVLLGHNVYGIARKRNVCDYQVKKLKAVYPKGKVVTVKILSVEGKKANVSLRSSDTGYTDPCIEKLAVTRIRRNSDRVSESDDVDDDQCSGRKRKISETGSETTGSPRKRRESESEMSRKRKDSDNESPALGTRKRRLSEMSDTKDESSENVQETAETNFADLARFDVDSSSSDEEVEVIEHEPVKKKKKKESKPVNGDKKATGLNLKEEFAWVTDFHLPTKSDSDSDSSDEDVDKAPVVAKENKKLEEKKLTEMENRLLDSSRTPETEEEFDRLVVQTPDSSLVWLQYMAHHLKMAEIDKGRKIAERALKTISFREEQEKLNVWVALLNLENTYGTPEQLKEVFDRALQMNDHYKVHCQLVNIYENSGKHEQAERLHSSIVRQFGHRKDAWMNFGQFYFGQKRFDSARKILERSLKSLDKRDHMEVVTKFGRMEFENHQTDQAVELFERVLTECPKRTDVWLVYIDLLIKFSTADKVRKVFLKLVELNIPAKKMRAVFKKWLEFETKHGDDETVGGVKERAAEYAQSNAEHAK